MLKKQKSGCETYSIKSGQFVECCFKVLQGSIWNKIINVQNQCKFQKLLFLFYSFLNECSLETFYFWMGPSEEMGSIFSTMFSWILQEAHICEMNLLSRKKHPRVGGKVHNLHFDCFLGSPGDPHDNPKDILLIGAAAGTVRPSPSEDFECLMDLEPGCVSLQECSRNISLFSHEENSDPSKNNKLGLLQTISKSLSRKFSLFARNMHVDFSSP